ncbi:MarR family transcriptional regulator [Ruminococcus sp. AF42-10]|nr:MarR family transcriptional regulator [Ruminococcus sp. AF42-10]
MQIVLYRTILYRTISHKCDFGGEIMCDDKSVKSCKCNKRFNDSIGHEIKVLNQVLQRKLIYSAKDKGVDKLTLMHGWIIAYLYDHRDEDVYQKDIENAFSIARSTVTSILKLMEKKNYITRESVESDARLKKLVLTETGIELHYKIENMITKNEILLNSLLTKEEKKQFLFLVNKILSGLENAN